MVFQKDMFSLDQVPILLLIIAVVVALRYFVVSGISYGLFFKLLRRRVARRRVQQKPFRNGQLRREILYSCSTIVIFATAGTAGMTATMLDWTLIYFDIHEYGLVYFWLSFPLTIFVHDTYFYWAHRFMHWRPIYIRGHALHHLSTNPSPFAAFAFHPIEAVIEAGIFAIFLFVIPLHIYVIDFFFVVMILWNVYVHTGLEFLPARWAKGFGGRWLGTPTHHNLHHLRFNGNYGLWFNFWDRLFSTNVKDYYEDLSAVATRAGERPEPPATTAPAAER